MGNLSRHFDSSEMKCHCNKCDFDTIDNELINLLENIRLHFGKPVHINSACRCLEHNRSIGSKDTSQHVQGTAADITIDGVSPDNIASYIDDLNPHNGGIGIYETFTHCDVRKNKARWRK